MVADEERRRVVAVLENPAMARSLRQWWSERDISWELVILPPRQAVQVLNAASELKQDLDRRGDALFARSLERFCDVTTDALPAPVGQERTLVVSQQPVPLDLVYDDDGDWGSRAIFSHVLLADSLDLQLVSRSVLDRPPVPLGTYLLVCPMAMDRDVPRHLQDIVIVATELEHELPVELWLQPSLDRTLQAFTQPHAGILHVDTHGSVNSVMLGPTRDGGEQVGVDRLPASISTPLVIIVGCELTGSADGIAAHLVRRGVMAAFGSFIKFQSLGIAGSEEGEAGWYRHLLRRLIAGDDLGRAVLDARQSVASGTLRYCWLTLGSSLLRFAPRSQNLPPAFH